MTVVDWRPKCTPIRDQGQCGSCTAFGTIGTWEGMLKIAGAIDPDLSERDLFSCSGGSCENGNTMNGILNQTLKGTCIESCCPYDGVDHNCGDGRCVNYTLMKCTKYTPTSGLENIKAALANGPLDATMTVYYSFFNYISGVYKHISGEEVAGGHCICIVGYDDTKNAFILRNSWGTSWGMSGYCYIDYGELDSVMYSITPDTTPPPTPVPLSVVITSPIAGASFKAGKRLTPKYTITGGVSPYKGLLMYTTQGINGLWHTANIPLKLPNVTTNVFFIKLVISDADGNNATSNTVGPMSIQKVSWWQWIFS